MNNQGCTWQHSNREQGGDEERGCRVKTLHASICFWEGGEGEGEKRENAGASSQ